MPDNLIPDELIRTNVGDEDLVITDFCNIIRQVCGEADTCKIKTSWRVPVCPCVHMLSIS